jgi:hypothetical protein
MNISISKCDLPMVLLIYIRRGKVLIVADRGVPRAHVSNATGQRFASVRTQSTVQEDVVAAAVEAAGVLVEATQAPLRALMNCVSAELSRGKWVGCCAVR